MPDRNYGKALTGNEVYGKYRDESDGTYSEVQRARLEGWDSGAAAWIKVAVSSTGAIQTSGSTAGGGGGAVTIADAADVAEGATTDAAVTTDTTGTVSGKLRGLVKWAFERMPAALGQTTMAASLPVAIASNQSAVPVSGTVSVASSTLPVTDNSGSLTVDAPVGTPVFTRLSDGSAALIGQKAMTASLPVAIASDQSALPASQSGTWTVQPGNTANTTAWKVDGSAVTQPTTIPVESTIATAVSSAAGAAITLSIASVASQFHYISFLQIVAYNTSARTGVATPVTVTTTNISGSPAFTFGSAGAIGTTEIQTVTPSSELKSTTAATPTTIVCPATTSVIWRINVVYRAAA